MESNSKASWKKTKENVDFALLTNKTDICWCTRMTRW